MTNNLKNLTIIILTADRLLQIKQLLKDINKNLHKYCFKVIIHDDGKKNDTKLYFNNLTKFNKNIIYNRNNKKLGHDKNYVKGLKSSKSNYTWIISDATKINNSVFKKLTLFLNGHNDLLILGVKNRKSYLDIEFNNLNKNFFLENFAWYLTLTGSFILSRRIISKINYIDFDKFKNFPHIGLIFNSIHHNKIKIDFIRGEVISSYPKKSYWVQYVFNIFLIDWPKSIFSLKNYKKSSQLIAIINHAKYSKIFSFKNLLYLKSEKLYNMKVFNSYKKRFKNFTNYNFFYHFLTLIIPLIFIKFLIYINRKIK
tara:strand:+ start:652 stop:1587 length:936 start_codon:yes stop_codon:yes gene_type:complete